MPVNDTITKEITKKEQVDCVPAISGINIEVPNRKVTITLSFGTLDSNGKFIVNPDIPTESKVIQDLPERVEDISQKKMSVSDGKITLDAPYQSNLDILLGDGSKRLFEGVDYTRVGNEITFMDASITEVLVSYRGLLPATTDFTKAAFAPVSTEHSIAGNVQLIAWKALGYDPSGIVIDDEFM